MSTLGAKLEQILKEAVNGGTIPASFVAVVDKEGTIVSQQVGNRLVDDATSGVVDEDTIFWLCSQTKLVTSIAALQMVDAGKITLDTPVEEVLPELKNPLVVTAHDESGRIKSTVPAKGKITFGQLLRHTSGLEYALDGKLAPSGPWLGLPPAYTHNYKGQGVEKYFDLVKGDLPGVPLRFEPGTNWAYGYGTDCAGFIVERLSGKSLEQYFQDHIFAPLGIFSASFKLSQDKKDKLLHLSLRETNGTLKSLDIPPFHDEDSEVYLGGVGLYSSQKDYMRLLQHLLQIKLGTATNPILSRSSIEALFTPTLNSSGADVAHATSAFYMPNVGIPAKAAQFSHGLLLNTADIPGKRKAGSGAWTGWANTFYFVDPSKGIAMVFGTQLTPPADDLVTKVFSQLEKEVYVA
ncbi:hypothetical protein MIND_00170000 [Mycena indigotica]|uniref:Beta-lactamase-related domain-containing protein n=1 Tax=Mycena indigotica TaxID=2126181 RepID=A0A8H6TF06_9AGAR|nr:uncharacterized protein MIND_00170000 [Mycena indigotica]KAF7316508.1 hypothetical protein MIND_00170000 [Mycena indigotica]